MEYKNISAGIADVDDASRRVKVIISDMESVDHDNDIISSSAFDKTIAERGPKGKNVIFHLTDHNTDLKNTLGKFRELYTQGNQLIGVTDINKTQWGNDVLEMYKAGTITAHSIGFQTISSVKSKGNEPRIIKEVRLFEGSACLFPANENTGTLSVGKAIFKSLNSSKEIVQGAEELFLEFQELYNEIKGGYPAENIDLLGIKFTQWEMMIKRLILSTQAVNESPGPQKDGKLIEVLKNANQLFKTAPVVSIAPPDNRQASYAGRLLKNFQRIN